MTAPGENTYPGGDLTPSQIAALADAALGAANDTEGSSGDMYRDLGLTDGDEDRGISPAAARAIADRVVGGF